MPGRKKALLPSDSPAPLALPLAEAARSAPNGTKPDALNDARETKKNYAQNLSQALATMFARCLAPRFSKARVTPSPDGSNQEFSVGGAIDRKKTDVGVWDSAAGLVLGVSIKTYSFRDFHGKTKKKSAHVGRYQRNVKRNDLELRDEADVLHRRQPYAVLFGVFFTPYDSCWDGDTGHSSFAHMVLTFRKRIGRSGPDSPRSDLFEKFYIGLMDEATGEVGFFDVENAPRKNQPPPALDLLDLADLIESMMAEVERRNHGGRRLADLYAEDDPTWSPPSSLPDGFDEDAPATIEDALAAPEPDDEDDD